MERRTLEETIGFAPPGGPSTQRDRLIEYVNLKLTARGFSTPAAAAGSPLQDFGRSLLANFEEKFSLFGEPLCPADLTINAFLKAYLGDLPNSPFQGDDYFVPSGALILERHGLARELSLPADADTFTSPLISSYRVDQGVCHNPAKDRRTTEGVFHVVEGGLPIPADKKAVPKHVFAHLLWHALHPPDDLLRLPYTDTLPADQQAKTFVSLLIRPLVCPEVPGVLERKTMEIRFFAPGVLVSNLDFVESIFGNAGDPFLPENDARLDAGHWTGHTGCVILAPQLCGVRKKDIGLPHRSLATPRQKKEGMFWDDASELYNGGQAFKIACRDASGVIVTLIADSYYGYCKKEVKTQISFAANLFGLCEEEHAGGVLAFPSFDLGETFVLNQAAADVNHTWAETTRLHDHLMTLKPDGYGVDKSYPNIIYLPETAALDLREQTAAWKTSDGTVGSLKILAGHTYVLPSGYKLEMQQSTKGTRWRLIGTQAEGTFCHKPCTVSGGGKSEISKALADAMITGPVMVRDFANDMQAAVEIIGHDFEGRFKNPRLPKLPSRPLLDPTRSFGSVVRMLTHSEQFTDEYNAWLDSIPRHVRDLVLVIKRRWHPEWPADWKSRFSVDIIDGLPGYELKYRNQKLITRYLRVGFSEDGLWRVFGIRKDFAPAAKLQREDDITASVVLPAESLSALNPNLHEFSHKFAANCEFRLFQRPDDAVIRGYDRVAETDFTKPNQFFSNYEPLPRPEASRMVDDAIRFGQFTEIMQDKIRGIAADPAASPQYFVCPANPRIVEGKPTKNPRYLQTRLDLGDPRAEYLAEIGSRFYRRLRKDQPVLNPAHSVLPGRRNNPAEPGSGIRPLAVYGAVHYQELPELFADFLASLTGKSPSTTGAGSEGALTKSPFNALLPAHDMNNAILSMILTGAHGFSSAAGHIGRKFRVEHDISLIIPEVWSRMHIHERDPAFLIKNGYLEKVRDIVLPDRVVPASRLGYRITAQFAQNFFGRVFSDPTAVLTDEMLRPELQSMEDYIDGVEHIAEGQAKIARAYFEDGSFEVAIPPLRALLEVLAHGHWEGQGLDSPELRALFDRDIVLQSDWYHKRLATRHTIDTNLWNRHERDLQAFLNRSPRAGGIFRGELQARLSQVKAEKANLWQTGVSALAGTIGADATLTLAQDAPMPG